MIRKGLGSVMGKDWGREVEKVRSWRLGWSGRIIRGALKNRLEGEKWDVEVEKGGRMRWKVVIGKVKEEEKEK